MKIHYLNKISIIKFHLIEHDLIVINFIQLSS